MSGYANERVSPQGATALFYAANKGVQAMNLGIVLRKYRLMMELDLRSLARDIGIGASTLMRIEHGYDPDFRTFKKIFDWLSR